MNKKLIIKGNNILMRLFYIMAVVSELNELKLVRLYNMNEQFK